MTPCVNRARTILIIEYLKEQKGNQEKEKGAVNNFSSLNVDFYI